MNNETIKQCLLEFYDTGIPAYVPRKVDIPWLSNTVISITGARKVGKTFLTYQIIDSLIKENIIESINKVCYLHFDDERLLELNASDLHRIDSLFLEISKSNAKSKIIFVFDEIHRIKGWEFFALRLCRNPDWRVLVTGSSTDLEPDKIGRQLRGKTYTCHLHPLSFKEFLGFKKISHNLNKLSVSNSAQIKAAFNDYVITGGYPALCTLSPSVRWEVLQQYFNSIVAADFLENHKIIHPQACKLYLRNLLQKNGCSYTHKKERNTLNSMGHKVISKDISNWFQWAQASYFVEGVTINSTSIKKQEQNYRKLYAVDWALANRVSPTQDYRLSRVLESIIYWHLRRQGLQVSYDLVDRDRYEVDFIINDLNCKPHLAIQVCLDLSDPNTIERETRSLSLLKKKYPKIETLIITCYEPSIISDRGFPVIEAWKWLLDCNILEL